MRFDLEKERLLLADAASGDRQAGGLLLSMHMPFIVSLAKRFYSSNCLEEELIQAGCTGLLLAIRRFDPSCGTRLLTYAYPWIIGEMKCVMRQRLQEEKAISLDSAESEEGRPLIEIIAGETDIDVKRIDLHCALASLPQDEQILITLRYFRDKSQAETARLLKKSQAQISRLERKALNRLGAMLA